MSGVAGGRYLVAACLSLVVSFGLFLMMQRLVTSRQVVLSEVVKHGQLEFVRLQRESPLVEKQRVRPQRPKELAPPEQPLTKLSDATQQAQGAVAAIPMPDAQASGIGAEGLRLRGGPKLGMAPTRDGSAVPLVRVDPEYPRAARQERIEGFVRVRFDISPTGRVLNPEVLESQPKGVFEQAALRAFNRWKYRPQVVAGKAVEQRNQITKIIFELER